MAVLHMKTDRPTQIQRILYGEFLVSFNLQESRIVNQTYLPPSFTEKKLLDFLHPSQKGRSIKLIYLDLSPNPSILLTHSSKDTGYVIAAPIKIDGEIDDIWDEKSQYNLEQAGETQEWKDIRKTILEAISKHKQYNINGKTTEDEIIEWLKERLGVKD